LSLRTSMFVLHLARLMSWSSRAI